MTVEFTVAVNSETTRMLRNNDPSADVKRLAMVDTFEGATPPVAEAVAASAAASVSVRMASTIDDSPAPGGRRNVNVCVTGAATRSTK
jgi:hypothetical protein